MLGWQHKVSFQQLVAEAVTSDLKELTIEGLRVLTAID